MILCLAAIGIYSAINCGRTPTRLAHFYCFGLCLQKRGRKRASQRELASIVPAMVCALWHMVFAMSVYPMLVLPLNQRYIGL